MDQLEDKCHPDPEGEELLGNNLKAFFG